MYQIQDFKFLMINYSIKILKISKKLCINKNINIIFVSIKKIIKIRTEIGNVFYIFNNIII